MKRALIALVGVCCIIAAATPTPALHSQAAVSKASATVDLVPGQPEAVVHITNHSPAALEAWRFVLSYELASGAKTLLDLATETLFDESPRGTPGHGPIPSGETRDKRVTLAGVPLATKIELKAAVFADASAEGDPTSILAQREQYASALASLSKALEAVSAHAAPQAKVALAKILTAERERDANPPSLVVSAHMTIAELLQVGDSEFAERLANVKGRFAEQRQRALSHKAHEVLRPASACPRAFVDVASRRPWARGTSTGA